MVNTCRIVNFECGVNLLTSLSSSRAILRPMSDFNPQRKYGLTDDKLSTIANALRDARDKALALYDPLEGDDPWCQGCRVYSRSRFGIRRLSEKLAWLTIVHEEENLRFTFAIDGLPIRFYRGSPDDPPAHYISVTYGELLQRQLFEHRRLDRILRIAVETDREGRVSTVKLVELDEAGEATGVYLIPFDIAPSNVASIESKPIHLDPVEVEPRKNEEHQEKKRKTTKGQ
jgi:hypothetical protein